MNVAVVTPYWPYPPDTGGKIRSFYLLRGLATEHAVDLFAVYYETRPNQTDPLRDLCRSAHLAALRPNLAPLARIARVIRRRPRVVDHFCSPAALADVRQRLQGQRYDLLIADEICMAPYVQGLAGPKLVIRHKVDHLHYRDLAVAQPLSARKALAWLQVHKLRRYEKRAMSLFNAAVCCSDDDAAAVQALNPEVPIVVIANGVDLDYFSPQEEVAGPPTVLYMGTMHYYPNIDAVQYFFERIHPHLVESVPDLRVLIVGHGPPESVLAWQRMPGVTITGGVPDVRPYLVQSTAMIVPLRLGGGTRLKILESLGAGRPVVSTTVGAEGLGLRHREHLLLADDPAEFARQTATLLRDTALRRRLVSAARPVVAEHFSWQTLGDQYQAACRRVATENAV